MPRPLRLLSSSLVPALLAACTVDADARRPRAGSGVGFDDDVSFCDVEVPAGFVSFHAGVWAVDDGDGGVLVLRTTGRGCDLVPSGRPIAADGLKDVDDAGNVYVMASAWDDAVAPGAVASRVVEGFGDTVARVSPDDVVTELVTAGRGIWEAAVSPAGDALYVTACGPTGIFSLDDLPRLTPALAPPPTLWNSMPSALTSSSTLWSVGHRTCVPGAAAADDDADDCGSALTRTDENGSVEVGATVVDFGAGPEQAVLARCGHDVCGVFDSAVVVYGGDGAVARVVGKDALGGGDADIAAVSGDDQGIYVTLVAAAGPRVVYVAR